MKKEPIAKIPATARPSKKAPNKLNGSAKQNATSSEFSKYLEPDFTHNLIEHMHRAKKAAMKDME